MDDPIFWVGVLIVIGATCMVLGYCLERSRRDRPD